MVPGDVERVLARFAAVWSSGDANAAVALFAEDATYGEPPRFAFTGREALRPFFADFFTRHHDVTFVIERRLIDAAANAVALSWTFTHTRRDSGHVARYQGMSFVDLTPTGLIHVWQGVSLPLAVER
jgi:uncharacterized protein (TIGR02246 family)